MFICGCRHGHWLGHCAKKTWVLSLPADYFANVEHLVSPRTTRLPRACMHDCSPERDDHATLVPCMTGDASHKSLLHSTCRGSRTQIWTAGTHRDTSGASAGTPGRSLDISQSTGREIGGTQVGAAGPWTASLPAGVRDASRARAGAKARPGRGTSRDTSRPHRGTSPDTTPGHNRLGHKVGTSWVTSAAAAGAPRPQPGTPAGTPKGREPPAGPPPGPWLEHKQGHKRGHGATAETSPGRRRDTNRATAGTPVKQAGAPAGRPPEQTRDRRNSTWLSPEQGASRAWQLPHACSVRGRDAHSEESKPLYPKTL